jgi:hypothetical protein
MPLKKHAPRRPAKGNQNEPEREVAVLDFETDPFKFGRVPEPFACGVLWRNVYVEFWGSDCWRRAADYLLSIDVPLVVYAHNGGKFDFFFMWAVLDNPIKIINGRIVLATLGIHELRDSWAIMPFALARYKKTVIDYSKFEPETRESNRTEILNYLHDDCCDLMDLCLAFVKRFGFRLTVAGTAMAELTSIHPQESQNETHDHRFRPYYHGGRVECFETGELRGDFKVFDVNSMYPAVMQNCDHPIGAQYIQPERPILDSQGWVEGYPGCLYFCEVEGDNLGALPTRELNGSLTFNLPYGTFCTTSHELRAAITLGKFQVRQLHSVSIPRYVQRFDDFVSRFSLEKIEAKKDGDKIKEIFSKLILNSAYGKFGQNPEKFCEYLIAIKGIHSDPTDDIWAINSESDHWRVWEKPSPKKRYFDVAIAASVTSAARAVLLHGIANAKRPVYCDTDSIICESLDVEHDEFALGAWKEEARGNRAAIAGKKLYALWQDREVVKMASKGVRIGADQILLAAQGWSVAYNAEAPNFSLNGSTKFVSRVVKKTA